MSNPNITVKVVVTSVPVDVTVNSHEHVEQLIREALHEARQGQGDALTLWILKDAAGDEIAPSERISSKISDGQKLFLNKDAGGGGACR